MTKAAIANYRETKICKNLILGHLKLAPESRHITLPTLPPATCPSESELPRPENTTLVQLRSRYFQQLNSYKACIFPCTSDRCPEYGLAPHTMAYLSDCLKHSSHLTVHDLWNQPAKAADFIYFTNYQLWQSNNMIRDDMMGYNNNRRHIEEK